jgi:hypothetical protein
VAGAVQGFADQGPGGLLDLTLDPAPFAAGADPAHDAAQPQSLSSVAHRLPTQPDTEPVP